MNTHNLNFGERFFWVMKDNNHMVIYTDRCGGTGRSASIFHSVRQLRGTWPNCKYFHPLGGNTTYDVSRLSDDELTEYLRKEIS